MSVELCCACRFHVVSEVGPVLALDDKWRTVIVTPKSTWIGCCTPISTARIQHGERPQVTMLKVPVTECLMFQKERGP